MIEGFCAPRVGFEPTTQRLTVACSAPELPRNVSLEGRQIYRHYGVTINTNLGF